MTERETLRAELIRDEGLRLVAYRDSVELWTIGVGHLLGKVRTIDRCTHEQAMAWLDEDIDKAMGVALGLVPALFELDEERRRALVNMAFNLGNRLKGFKLFLACVNAGEWSAAGVEALDSKWAKQVGDRALRIRDMIVMGSA